MTREQFQKIYYKAHNWATDKVGSDPRCWGDLLADRFCELYSKTQSSDATAGDQKEISTTGAGTTTDTGSHAQQAVKLGTSICGHGVPTDRRCKSCEERTGGKDGKA